MSTTCAGCAFRVVNDLITRSLPPRDLPRQCPRSCSRPQLEHMQRQHSVPAREIARVAEPRRERDRAFGLKTSIAWAETAHLLGSLVRRRQLCSFLPTAPPSHGNCPLRLPSRQYL
eukprot:scaffold294129_cov33-Tisochrysis_lutea.AAC.2